MRTDFLKPSSTWIADKRFDRFVGNSYPPTGRSTGMRSSAHLKPISRKLWYLTVALTSSFRNGEQRSRAKSPRSSISRRATLWRKIVVKIPDTVALIA
jgi:hypothetical protein